MLQIKVKGLEMCYSESSAEEAARQVAEDFDVLVTLTGEAGRGGGWPVVDVIGTPKNIIKMLTSETGWAVGDEIADAEMVYHYLREAEPVTD